MTASTVKGLSDQSVLCAEVFAYDAAGNFTDAEDSDTSGRLAVLAAAYLWRRMDTITWYLQVSN